MDDYQARFWSAFGPLLFGQARAPQTSEEWISAGKQLRALTQLDALATRLEQATAKPVAAAQRPQARQQHPEAGSVEYDSNGDPICPEHRKPLRQGKYGYFCPCKSERGKNGYCDYRVKDA